ncbi:MAG: hypothetical protein ACXWQO_02195 [Bdellovibrionota bacterium]
MKISILALVAFVTLPNLAHANDKLTPNQVVGSTIAACPAGAVVGAGIGGIIYGAEGAKKGAIVTCIGTSVFAAGIGIANAAENEPDQQTLNKEDAVANEEDSQ